MNAMPWNHQAIQKIEADYKRSADTHLIKVDLPAALNATLYLKDESTHPTGSLKHRLARSLFLYSLANGWVNEGTPIIECSSGSTAVSEAYFARLLGLPFYAVMPSSTSKQKIRQIEHYGGICHFADSGDLYQEARLLAQQTNGHYMDQFTYAERATDWRGNNNVAESMFSQLELEPHPIPDWVVVSAGTGGTPATIGRYLNYQKINTQLCVADPEHSVFFDYFKSGDSSLTLTSNSRIEGIGRPRVESSFMASVIDAMIKVPDAASIATAHALEKVLNRKVGASTGTNVYATLQLLARTANNDRHVTLLSMICDSGERYIDTYYNPKWLYEHGFDLEPYQHQLQDIFEHGHFAEDFESSIQRHSK
ncbi:PLP-dependent cysteine synthase family protein [Echinimonas agarilytica]|uniref:L-cysteine desulfhydrase Cds1 n=1 Tax=Echinimonas agarilytica TaxID=1215918 RepID=A0AA42B617_9GAMM|nr:PLP-dependent cysteine synthase family protein [Echinimonas agarilytica]MCM2678144.1 PLP-dependent cysteine synthase family protein [Echinimonas agarilytica]